MNFIEFLKENVFYRKTDNRSLIIKGIKKHEAEFQRANNSLMADKQFVLEALSIRPEVYQYIDEELKKDKEIILYLAQNTDAKIFKYVDKSLLKEKEFINKLLNINTDIFDFVSEDFKTEHQLMIAKSYHDGLFYCE